MSFNEQYNLFGKKVSDTYPNLLQSGSDGIFYDGTGNSVTINATIPDIYVLTSSFNSFTSSYNTGSFTGSFIGDGSGLTGVGGGSINTGSLLTTASFTTPNLTFTKGDSSAFNVNISSLTGSLIRSSQTSSMSVASASFATTASYISGSVFTSTNPALSASYALTASYLLPSPSAGLVYYMTTNPASLTVSGGVEQNLASITIPANTVQVGDRLEIFYSFNKVGTNATSAYRVRISGSGIDGTLLNNGAAQGVTVLGLTTQNLYRVLSTSSMVGSSQFFGGAATVGTAVNYTGSSLTGSNTFYFNAIRNSVVDTITLNDCYIKIIR